MRPKYWLFALLAISLISGGVTWYWLLRPAQATVVAPPAPNNLTVVCGSYANPILVVGVPIETTETTIRFADGYLLRLREMPSLFLERRALFEIQDRQVTKYGTVKSDSFHPCPSQEK